MDEGSMASLPLLAEFFMHMKRSARVLICGDRNQLPSVDEGAVINDLYHAGGGGNALMPGVVRELKTNF
ncbi:MAG: AAA family ATPase, partial [Victivallales bacterium]|nr:AAA family ATPase [Victivallales bacterium]